MSLINQHVRNVAEEVMRGAQVPGMVLAVARDAGPLVVDVDQAFDDAVGREGGFLGLLHETFRCAIGVNASARVRAAPCSWKSGP